mmetsp:Transcript_19897/g.57162  ORF Transcript_19897/g.57162 Transcript_19897/m.57162 type:complete len:397 (-) Transcript_19897:129-1319(-)
MERDLMHQSADIRSLVVRWVEETYYLLFVLHPHILDTFPGGDVPLEGRTAEVSRLALLHLPNEDPAISQEGGEDFLLVLVFHDRGEVGRILAGLDLGNLLLATLAVHDDEVVVAIGWDWRTKSCRFRAASRRGEEIAGNLGPAQPAIAEVLLIGRHDEGWVEEVDGTLVVRGAAPARSLSQTGSFRDGGGHGGFDDTFGVIVIAGTIGAIGGHDYVLLAHDIVHGQTDAGGQQGGAGQEHEAPTADGERYPAPDEEADAVVLGMELHGDGRTEALAQDVLGGLLGRALLAGAAAALAAGAGLPRGLGGLAVLLPGLSLPARLLAAALLTDVWDARLIEADAPIAGVLEVAFDLGGVTIRACDWAVRIDAAIGTVGSSRRWVGTHYCLCCLLKMTKE